MHIKLQAKILNKNTSADKSKNIIIMDVKSDGKIVSAHSSFLPYWLQMGFQRNNGVILDHGLVNFWQPV